MGSKLPVIQLCTHTFEGRYVRLVADVEGRAHSGAVSVFFYRVTTKGGNPSWVAEEPGKYDTTMQVAPARYAIVANQGSYSFTVAVFEGR
jgi:hypothetical protein